MTDDPHDLPIEQYHGAGLAITNGNAEIYKQLYSHRDDVTLANPFGPPARGWKEVSSRADTAAQNYRDGEVVGFENVSTVVGADLAYLVEIERYRARVGGAKEMSSVSLRAQIKRIDERVDHVNGIVVADPIVQAFGQKGLLETVGTFDKSTHPIPPSANERILTDSSVFTQPAP